VEDRLRYYETLQLGNDGDIRPFIRFIADSTERTLDEYLSQTMDNYGHSLQHARENSTSSDSHRIIYIDNEDVHDDDS
jgi:hypothetical protein